jgi:hypothetical protein
MRYRPDFGDRSIRQIDCFRKQGGVIGRFLRFSGLEVPKVEL